MSDESDPDLASDEEEATTASRLARFGGVVTAGVLAAVVAAGPSALRVSREGAALGVTWLILAGAAVLPSTLLVVVLRRAKDGLRSLAGDAAAARLAGLVAWVDMLLFFLVGFGAILRKKTHHHGLAGATFGVVALLFAIASALLAARLARGLAGRAAIVQQAAAGVMIAVLLASILLLGSSLARGSGAGTTLGPWVVDAAGMAVAATLASGTPIARVKPLALLGPPLAVVLLALCGSLSRSHVDVLPPLHARAPGYAFVGGPLIP